jgi:TetR/AcrR family transcriptional repressor of nem operon
VHKAAFITALDKSKTTGHIESMPRVSLRENILESALEQFHRLGFAACSVEDITRHAGVPKGSFYNHFKSKEDLAVHVIDLYVEAAPNDILGNTSITPLKRLKQHFGLLAQVFIDSGFQRGCLLSNFVSELADHSPVVQQKLHSALAQWTEHLAKVIREGQQSGEISSAHKAESWAGFLLSAYEGALMRTRAAKDPRPLREFNTLALTLLAA